MLTRDPNEGKGSAASTNGLGALAEGKDPPLLDGAKKPDNNRSAAAEDIELSNVATGIVRNDSACHSYHTRRSFVNRQTDTWSSELLGKYKGSCKTSRNRLHTPADDAL
jgi:hypothetical protein